MNTEPAKLTGTWADDAVQRGAAWKAIAASCWSLGLLTPAEYTSSKPWEVKFVAELVRGCPVRMPDYPTLNEYIEAMGEYLAETYPPMSDATITASIGGVSITSAYQPGISLRGQVAALQRRLAVAVDGLVAQSEVARPSAAGGETETFPVEGIDHSFENGKHAIKVKGGPFQQWGVRVWPEVLAAAGLSIENLPLGLTPYAGTMTCTVQDGKVKKVIKLDIRPAVPSDEHPF